MSFQDWWAKQREAMGFAPSSQYKDIQAGGGPTPQPAPTQPSPTTPLQPGMSPDRLMAGQSQATQQPYQWQPPDYGPEGWRPPARQPETYGADYWGERGFGGYADYAKSFQPTDPAKLAAFRGESGDSPFGGFGRLTEDNIKQAVGSPWVQPTMQWDMPSGGSGSRGGPFIFNDPSPAAPTMDRMQPASPFNMQDPYPAPERGPAPAPPDQMGAAPPTYQRPPAPGGYQGPGAPPPGHQRTEFQGIGEPPPVYQRDEERYRKLLGY